MEEEEKIEKIKKIGDNNKEIEVKLKLVMREVRIDLDEVKIGVGKID